MVAHTSDIKRNTERDEHDCTFSLYSLSVHRILDKIGGYKINITNFSRLPLSIMMRVSINKLNSNLQKLESIGTDLSNRLKHTRAMGEFDGKEGLIQQLEIEIDLFFEMMKVQTQKYMQVVQL